MGVAAEYLRSFVATEAEEPSNTSRYPVPTLRLTQELNSRLTSLWPALNNKEQNHALEQLEQLNTLGELIKTQGRWYLAPLRSIVIDSSTVLLMGGGPSIALPYNIKKELQIVGRARIVNRTSQNHKLLEQIPVQKLEDWLDAPTTDVFVWAKAFIRQQLQHRSNEDELEDADIYVPHRWIPFIQYKGDASILLFRRQVLMYGARRNIYGLAKATRLDQEKLSILAAINIERNDARRLQAVIWENERRVRIDYFNCGELIALRIPFPLPAPENRFLNLGWPRPCSVGSKQWPKEYYFSNRLFPLLEKALALLGYELKKRIKANKYDGEEEC